LKIYRVIFFENRPTSVGHPVVVTAVIVVIYKD